MFDDVKRKPGGREEAAGAPASHMRSAADAATELAARVAAVPAADLGFVQYFNTEFAPRLGKREAGFRIMFNLLERGQLAGALLPLIVETGSLRQHGNWEGDGQSTIQFAAFADAYPSEVHTVDLAPEAAELVRRVCGTRVTAHTGDSVAYLHGLGSASAPRKIDLLYLDSYDFDPADPFPSAFHHIKELIAARPCLSEGSIVAIDDNIELADGSFTGKGYLAKQWFDHVGIKCLHQGYQYIWQL